MNQPSWHSVIDDVARGMTAGDPAPEFRARVMARIAATPSSSRLSVFVRSWRGATVVATTVVAGVALSVTQSFRSPAVRPSIAASHTASTPVVETTGLPGAGETPAPTQVGRRAPAPQRSAALAEWRARNIPALPGPAALDVASIQPAGLSISQLSVTPLDIAPIAIPSIPQTEGGR